MTDERKLVNPTNRVVCVFDEHHKAVEAKDALVKEGFTDDDLRLLHGELSASQVDTSAKWFADTDEEIEKFQQELRAGNSTLSIPVQDSECREQLHALLKSHDARRVTHFGEWVTEVMR